MPFCSIIVNWGPLSKSLLVACTFLKSNTGHQKTSYLTSWNLCWPLAELVYQLTIWCEWFCSYPQRVSKLKATVRYMFHNPEDVRWFKVRKHIESKLLRFDVILVNLSSNAYYLLLLTNVFYCSLLKFGQNWVAVVELRSPLAHTVTNSPA